MIYILVNGSNHFEKIGFEYIISDELKDAHISFAAADNILQMLNEFAFDILIIQLKCLDFKDRMFIVEILRQYPVLRIIVFSDYPSAIFAERYLRIGVHSYLQKNISEHEFRNALHVVARGGTYPGEPFDLCYGSKKKTKNYFENLSDRELDITMLLLKGETAGSISSLFQIGNSTVATYKKRIYTKLRVKNYIELLDLATHQLNYQFSIRL